MNVVELRSGSHSVRYFACLFYVGNSRVDLFSLQNKLSVLKEQQQHRCMKPPAKQFAQPILSYQRLSHSPFSLLSLTPVDQNL